MTLRYTKYLMCSGLVPAFLFITILKFVYHVPSYPFSPTIIAIYWVLLLAPIGIAVSPWYRKFEQSRERSSAKQQ